MDERELHEVFAASDVGWVLTEDTTRRAQQFLREMRDIDRLFNETFHRPLVPRLADAILADVTRFKPLVQTFASPMTPPIRTMVYCVLDGAQVKAISRKQHSEHGDFKEIAGDTTVAQAVAMAER